MPTVPADALILARISGGNNTRTTPVDPENQTGNPARGPNHLLFSLFDYAKLYYNVLNGPYLKTPVTIDVNYAGANPQPNDYFNALRGLVETKFPGYTINQAEAFTGLSYWDGRRWIRPTGAQVSYSYPFRPRGAGAIKEAVWVDDDQGNEVSLILDFLAVIQRG